MKGDNERIGGTLRHLIIRNIVIVYYFLNFCQ